MSRGSLIELARERLVDLNPKAIRPEEIAEALYVSESVDKFSQQIRKRSWQGDIHQLLLPFFRSLFQKEVGVRERVVGELLSFGLSAELVSGYFLNMGNQPYLIFALKHEEMKEGLPDKAEEIMLRELRSYLF